MHNYGRTKRVEVVISLQNIAELYSMLTDRRRLKAPLEPAEAARVCTLYLDAAQIAKIRPDEEAMKRALELAVERGIGGLEFFDCFLAATMERNGIGLIFTQNLRDFGQYEFLRAEFPLKQAEGQ